MKERAYAHTHTQSQQEKCAKYETTRQNRYESHYISRDFIMCVAMIMCIMGLQYIRILLREYKIWENFVVQYISVFLHITTSGFLLFCTLQKKKKRKEKHKRGLYHCAYAC